MGIDGTIMSAAVWSVAYVSNLGLTHVFFAVDSTFILEMQSDNLSDRDSMAAFSGNFFLWKHEWGNLSGEPQWKQPAATSERGEPQCRSMQFS